MPMRESIASLADTPSSCVAQQVETHRFDLSFLVLPTGEQSLLPLLIDASEHRCYSLTS
jgi:hypothetical protein